MTALGHLERTALSSDTALRAIDQVRRTGLFNAAQQSDFRLISNMA